MADARGFTVHKIGVPTRVEAFAHGDFVSVRVIEATCAVSLLTLTAVRYSSR